MLPVMSVPLALLGLLERGPSHGYDLKRDYDAYFGRGRPLRYSQVYATLSRLARDGKAAPGPVEQGLGPNVGDTPSPNGTTATVEQARTVLENAHAYPSVSAPATRTGSWSRVRCESTG
jgi:hypothetical protein